MQQNNNVAVLLGRLVSEPEIRTIPSGAEVMNFTIAVDRPIGKNGEKTADFIDCVAWRNTATFIGKYFHKGDPISLSGTIQTRSYEYEGKKRRATEVLVECAGFTGAGKPAAPTPSLAERTAGAFEGDVEADDLPF